MNKEQRKPYLGLTTVPLQDRGHPCLCSFCKYARWYGPCAEAELDCTHPLDKKFEVLKPGDVSIGEGADCWGFRPYVDVDEAADMVGIWLQGKAIAPR